MSSFQIFNKLIIENTVQLLHSLNQVIATTCDKAAPNQKFVRLHIADGLCYKTANYFTDDREIYFISDAGHSLPLSTIKQLKEQHVM